MLQRGFSSRALGVLEMNRVNLFPVTPIQQTQPAKASRENHIILHLCPSLINVSNQLHMNWREK